MPTGAIARTRFELVFDVGCSIEGWELHNFVYERRVRIAAAGRRGFLNQKLMLGGRRLTQEGFGVSDASPRLRASWSGLEPNLRALLRHFRPTRFETAFAGKLGSVSEVVDLLRAFDASVPFLAGELTTPPRFVRSRFVGRDQQAIRGALRSIRRSPLRLPADHSVAFQLHRPRRTRDGWACRPWILAIPEGIEAGLTLWTNEAGPAQRHASKAATKRLRRSSFDGTFSRLGDGVHGIFTKRVRTRARLLEAARFASSFVVGDGSRTE